MVYVAFKTLKRTLKLRAQWFHETAHRNVVA
jgi:hypothetical protein